MLKAILFDFDGVIIDSAPITVKYFKEAIEYFGFPVPSEKQIKSYFGLKTKDMFKKLLPDLDESKLNKVYEYGKKLSLKYATEIPLIPNALDVIRKLSFEYKLGLVTSRGKEGVLVLSKKYRLDDYFRTVVDREDVKNHKPHPEPLLKALNKLGTKHTEAVYVGDTESDVGAAKNAKMPCILIAPDNSLGADYQIKNIQELPAIINKIKKDFSLGN